MFSKRNGPVLKNINFLINKYRLSDARRGREPVVVFVIALLTKLSSQMF